MAKDPTRHEIPVKLLEIYAARKSASSFETVARELRPVQLARIILSGRGSRKWVANSTPQIRSTRPLPESLPRQQCRPHLRSMHVHPMSPCRPLRRVAHDLDFDLKLPTAKPSVAKLDLPVSEVRGRRASSAGFRNRFSCSIGRKSRCSACVRT